MTSIALGPLALPASPLLLVLAAWLARTVANLLARRAADAASGPVAGGRAGPATAGAVVVQAVWVGLAAARIAYLGQHVEAYAEAPWEALDLRDGGWHAATGAMAALAWGAWQAWRQRPWRQALGAGAVVGFALWAAGLTWLQHRGEQTAMSLAALEAVPLAELQHGTPVRLQELAQGRPVVLNLWASWCAPCRSEMPALAAAQARHPGAVFVFANQGEDAAVVRRYLAAEHLALATVVLDGSRRLGPALGSGGLPTTVFFDAHGQRVDTHMGALGQAALAARLHELQASAP